MQEIMYKKNYYSNIVMQMMINYYITYIEDKIN